MLGKIKNITNYTFTKKVLKADANNNFGILTCNINITHKVDYIRIKGFGTNVNNVADDSDIDILLLFKNNDLVNTRDGIIGVSCGSIKSTKNFTNEKIFTPLQHYISGTYIFTVENFIGVKLDDGEYGEYFIELEFIELEVM